MRRGLVPLLSALVLLTGCHEQWGGSTWGSSNARSDDAAAQAEVRASIPAIEAFYADNGTYAGMTLEGLRITYDQGLPDVFIAAAKAQTYCVESTEGAASYFKDGPAAEILPGHCGDSAPPPPPSPPEPIPTHTDAEELVLSVVPAIEVYYAEHGTYAGVEAVDQVAGISLSQVRIYVRDNGTGYCVEGPRQGASAHFVGPRGQFAHGPC
jgi:hypothetical protein